MFPWALDLSPKAKANILNQHCNGEIHKVCEFCLSQPIDACLTGKISPNACQLLHHVSVCHCTECTPIDACLDNQSMSKSHLKLVFSLNIFVTK